MEPVLVVEVSRRCRPHFIYHCTDSGCIERAGAPEGQPKVTPGAPRTTPAYLGSTGPYLRVPHQAPQVMRNKNGDPIFPEVGTWAASPITEIPGDDEDFDDDEDDDED